MHRCNAAPRCRAKSKRTGLPCQSPAVRGHRVCRMHGARGGAPEGKRKGNFRMVPAPRRHRCLTLRQRAGRCPVEPRSAFCGMSITRTDQTTIKSDGASNTFWQGGRSCETENPAGLVYIANANDLLPPCAVTNFQKMLPAKLAGDFARHIGNAD